MQHYTDRQQAAAQGTRAANRMAAPVGQRDDNRQPGRLLLDVNGVVIDLHLVPDPRDVRRWKAYREGQPYMRAGLEQIWRKVQSEQSPVLGRRHWGD
jgi:hypothetical protein